MAASDDPAISRQQRVGAVSRDQTRRRLQEASTAEFIEHGYAAATVSRIAARAGVTVQTLYLVWGSKRALLRASMTASLSQSLGSVTTVGDRFAGLTPPQITSQMAAIVARTAASAGTFWTLHRDAAGSDPEIAADWEQLQSLRRVTFERIVAHLPLAALRPGLDHEAARDTAWAIASPETYELLVRRAGYTLDEWERWLDRTLTASLLA